MLGINIPCPKFLRCLGKAFAEEGLLGLVEEIPYAGFVVKICASAYNKYHDEQQDEDIARALPKELEQIVQTDPVKYEQQCQQIAEEVLPNQPAKVRKALAGSLMLVQGQIRKTFTRKEDLTGKSRPPAFVVRGPQDLESIIPPRPPRFHEGDLLPNDPQWVLVKRLDSGGFGEVWKAQHVHASNLFKAVKFCLDETAQDRLLKHEARVINQVMQIKNDHIVKLEGLNLSLPSPWLRYEFIEGGNLLTSVRMPEDIERRAAWAKNMMLPLARTVGACHLLSPAVVHRDLKPANVLIELVEGHDGKKRPRLKVTDFGISEIIAQQALDQAQRETPSRASFATPTILRGSYTAMYASEQQRAGLPSAPTDDVNALGVMWFQFLMGDCFLPLGRDYREDLADLKLCDELIGVLAKCVADKAERRWPNAKILAQQIVDLPANLLKTAVIPSKPAGERSEPAGSVPLAKPAPPLPTKSRPAILVCTGPNGADSQRVKTLQKEWSDYLGVPIVHSLDLGGSVKLEMVLVPPGKFMMGSPDSENERCDDEKLHEVELTRPFFLAKFPVLQEQYTHVMQVTNPSWFCSLGSGKDSVKSVDNRRFPVEQVNYEEATEFCTRLPNLGLGKFTTFRLPTEAEWEYACRAGTRSPFHFGAILNGNEANCDGNNPYGTSTKGKYLQRTCEAGKYPANSLGLYDMHGNVWEWCMDWYGNYPTSKVDDPSGSESGSLRLCRGGGWYSNARRCRAAFRDSFVPGERISYLGFRLALVPSGAG